VGLPRCAHRYNLIIPDVFPDVPPGPLDPLPATVLKRIEKLTEYAERSPSKIPKVSTTKCSSTNTSQLGRC
jgi:hypothetical protein